VRRARHTDCNAQQPVLLLDVVDWSRTAVSLQADLKDCVGASQRGVSFLPNRGVVFVVDDDPGTLRGVRRLLREYGYDSVLFPSAEAFQNHDGFEEAFCVILDINLNNESGIELRHRLKAAGISVPVIFITGNDNPATRMAALESGCIAYLTKPFSAKSLIEPLEKASAGLA
jgi:FixJ family two-component response regulator